MEGTHIRPDGARAGRAVSERQVEEACVDLFQQTSGMVLALYSPQNIDRLVTMYRAALRSGRDLVMDLYAAAMAAATGRATIPQADWRRVRVYLPHAQRSRVLREQAFCRTDAVRSRRIYPQELADRRAELVMTFRLSMGRELAATGCLTGAHAVWSMWPGYLRQPSGAALEEFLARGGIPLSVQHASGHAFVADLQRLVGAIRPERVVPIHSFGGDQFKQFFDRVDRRYDGDWWQV
jgi:ribonuclease J